MSKTFDKDRKGTGTKEWSEHSFNIGKGCSHGCLYCYARANALRFKLIENREDWETEIVNDKALLRAPGKKDGVIMYPTTHDITPTYLEGSVTVLKAMLSKGNDVLIVSKPHLDCIKRLCTELVGYKDHILFRFTIGSLNDEVVKLWEPGAPTPQERLEALKYAYENGFKTSVSMEPMLLNVDDTLLAFQTLKPYVTDKLWIGKMNKIDNRVEIKDPKAKEIIDAIKVNQSDPEIKRLYNILKDDDKVAWKDSIKQVISID
jgi:DNA repair photolyase